MPLSGIELAREITMRLLCSVLSAFSAFTLTWVVWGLFTPGDYFANGNSLLLPSLGAAVVIGAIADFGISRRWRIVPLAAAVLSLCFWIFAPDGWWAHGPPVAPPRTSLPSAAKIYVGQPWSDAREVALRANYQLHDVGQLEIAPTPDGFYLDLMQSRGLIVYRDPTHDSVAEIQWVENWSGPKAYQKDHEVREFEVFPAN